jgi:hypothetical protein
MTETTINPNNVVMQFTITGMKYYPGAWDLICRLKPGCTLLLEREPRNRHDANAVIVKWGARQLGYLPRDLAGKIAPLMDGGVKVIVRKASKLTNHPGPLPHPNAVCDLAYIKPTTEEVPNGNATGSE